MTIPDLFEKYGEPEFRKLENRVITRLLRSGPRVLSTGGGAKAATVYQGVQAILPEDIANTVLWISEQPAHVNINSIEIMPVAQTFGPLHISRR
jgi:shikimate kinase